MSCVLTAASPLRGWPAAMSDEEWAAERSAVGLSPLFERNTATATWHSNAADRPPGHFWPAPAERRPERAVRA